jgi:hypothetical protein
MSRLRWTNLAPSHASGITDPSISTCSPGDRSDHTLRTIVVYVAIASTHMNTAAIVCAMILAVGLRKKHHSHACQGASARRKLCRVLPGVSVRYSNAGVAMRMTNPKPALPNIQGGLSNRTQNPRPFNTRTKLSATISPLSLSARAPTAAAAYAPAIVMTANQFSLNNAFVTSSSPIHAELRARIQAPIDRSPIASPSEVASTMSRRATGFVCSALTVRLPIRLNSVLATAKQERKIGRSGLELQWSASSEVHRVYRRAVSVS